MPLFDWSTNILGYPRHQRSGSPMVGLSHMITHDALAFAQDAGLGSGWMHLTNPQPHLEDLPEGEPVWVDLSELFVDQRIAHTEGIVSGAVTFIGAAAEDGPPPSDRPLTTWAEEIGRIWVQMIDNECTYWGGVDDTLAEDLLRWFCCQHPINRAWTEVGFEADVAAFLRAGLFVHGWTRNNDLVAPGGRAAQDLWGGIHTHCILDHEAIHALAAAQVGVRLILRGEAWQGAIIDDEPCPLNDENGRMKRPA
jgi:hypothetical protein